MRKLKSISWVSVIVIVGSLGVLLLIPAERDRVRSAAVNQYFAPHLRAQVAARPDDPQAGLALADNSVGSLDTLPRNLEAFERVFKLKPRWAAPHLLLGAAAVYRVPLVRPQEHAAYYRGDPERATPKAEPLTADQRRALRLGTEALRQARSLDPDNAAPDYLLAYLALAQHRDEDALTLLRSGSAKKRWSAGQREATIARYQAYVRAMPGLEAGMFARYFWPGWVARPLRELARTVTGMAMLAQERGDDEQAIFLRQSMMHLGSVVMADGYTLIDVLVGIAVWHIGVAEILTPAEKAAALKGLSRGKPEAAWRAENRAYELQQTAGMPKLTKYLRAHGHARLADSVPPTSKALRAWSSDARDALAADEVRTLPLLRLLSAFPQALMAAGGAVGLLVLCGAACLVLLALGRRPTPITWAEWKWGLVVLGCGAVPFARIMIYSHGRLWLPILPDLGEGYVAATPSWGRVFAIVGLPLLVVATAVVVWALRRRIAPSERPGYGRHYVGTLMAVLLPLTAVMLAGCVIMSVPLVARAAAQAHRYGTMVYRGEATYYGVKPPAAPVPAPAPQGKGPLGGQE